MAILITLSLAVLATGSAHGEVSSGKPDSGWRTPLITGVNPEKREYYEDLGRRSDKILIDRSFVEKWRKPGALQTLKQAEDALDEADRTLDLVDRAVKNKTAACYYTFLVNQCISEAKELSYAREREIQGVMSDARTILHKVKTEENARKKAERLAKPLPQPVDIAPKTVKPAPSKLPVTLKPKEVQPAPIPSDYSKKEVKEPSQPTGWDAKTVREPSAPSRFKAQTEKAPSMPSGMNMPGTESKSATSIVSKEPVKQPTREELEQANLEALAQKEAEAAERQRQADEEAKARKAKREARNKRFREDQEKRRAAQLEYERTQKEGRKEVRIVRLLIIAVGDLPRFERQG